MYYHPESTFIQPEYVFSPDQNRCSRETGIRKVTEAMSEAMKQAAREWDIRALFIPSINREKSPEDAVAMVDAVLQYPHPLVPGIGIDYKENDAPIEHFWKAYRKAEQGGGGTFDRTLL